VGREIGAVIGEYRLLESLGSGAAGEVFKAEHVITHRLEAVKFLTHGRPVTAEEEQSFRREIEVQAALQHPNIAAVYNACWTPEGLALAMELVDGEPLSAILARGRVPLPNAIRYVLETLDGLGYAHSRGIVHGDVKPANIMVGRGGAVKLTDFGLARPLAGPQLTPAGTPAGSPYYMSPEQVIGAPFDVRSDYYSLGVVLYEVVTGRRPFEGENAFDVMLQQRDAVPVPPIRLTPGIGAELNRVILTALEKDPARRYQFAIEFRSALERAVAASPLRRRSVLRRWLVATALAGLGAAMMGSLHRAPVSTKTQLVKQTPAPAAPPKPTVPEAPAPASPVSMASETVTTPPPTDPSPKTNRSRAPVKQHKAEPRTVVAGPRTTEPSIWPPETREEVKPQIATELPVAPPAPPARAPAAEPSRTAPPAALDAAPDNSATQPPKRRNVVWRALGHIIHPRSGGSGSDASTQKGAAGSGPERPRQ
jgi:serine/threonine protein kinase